MDDDSYIESALDNIVETNNTLIFAKESNIYNDACYLPSYRLSKTQMGLTYLNMTANLTALYPTLPTTSAAAEEFIDAMFDHRIVVSWALFVQPRHPLMLHVLTNIVDLIKNEYFLASQIHMMKYDVRWKKCMCSTGPSMLTASMREYFLPLLLQQHITAASQNRSLMPLQLDVNECRIIHKDYVDFGGNFKFVRGHLNETNHYMHIMQVLDFIWPPVHIS